VAYCGGATSTNASYLSAASGLHYDVALAWLWNECQSAPNPTNPLNIIKGGTPGQVGSYGAFGVYSSPQAGLNAAAWLIRNGSYSGIRSAIATGDSNAQAVAIQSSPWAAGHYGYSAIVNTLRGVQTGFIKSYIGSVIDAAAWLKNWASGSIPTGTSGGGGTATSSTCAGAVGFCLPTGTVLTSANIHAFADAIFLKWPDSFGTAAGGSSGVQVVARAATLNVLMPFVGQPWNDATIKNISNALGAAATNSQSTVLGVVGGAIGNTVAAVLDVPGQILSGVGKLVSYVVALLLILVGIWLYAKGTAQPAMTEGMA
jgi:hypothetical protein